jgi:hypothetical protein
MTEFKFSDGSEWQLITMIEPGDLVHRWGNDLEVVSVVPLSGSQVRLTVIETDGQEKSWDYKDTAELIWKRKGV